jgi:serine phosphatase RsbU (regulator of sigma subunit)
VITRIAVADVTGHGASVASFSSSLRTLLRKNINHKSQRRLVERLNRDFGELAGMRRFATALVITYLASTDRLTVSNAGHPSPLLFRAIDGTWSLLEKPNGTPGRAANLPLGLGEETTYQALDVELGRGDIAVFYTDALSEAVDASGKLLGEQGLLKAARTLDTTAATPASIGKALLAAVSRHRGPAPAGDDVTLVVLHHNAAGSPRLSLAQKVDVYAKVFGLKKL